MPTIEYVKDYQGKLIPRNKARLIKNELGKKEYFEENVSCVKMEDGQWYRTTTGKIIFDWSKKQWIYKSDFKGLTGLVEDGSIGHFSNLEDVVNIRFKKDFILKRSRYNPLNKEFSDYAYTETKWNNAVAISEEVALKLGFKESYYDGYFWKVSDCNAEELDLLNRINIPQSERHNTYSLDDDKHYRNILEDAFSNAKIKVDKNLTAFYRKFIPFTLGVEIEIQNGFVRRQKREQLGFRTCRDGSLDTGQEYVSIPYDDGKGLQAIKLMCEQLNRRTEISNKCSVHVHFGDVRRDKLYVLSFWCLFYKVQNELAKYFPYSRTNTIREDGKVYAALLPDLKLDTHKILKCNKDDEFKQKILTEFNKIYTYLNNGHPLGEKYSEEFVKQTKEFIIQGEKSVRHCFRVKTSNFTTKLPVHAVQGRKWERKTRYHAVNLLNLFFAHSKTIEFRLHEATTNFDKILNMISLFAAMLTYAENFEKCLGKEPVTIKDIIFNHFPDKHGAFLYDYFLNRKTIFCDGSKFKPWKEVEQAWLDNDKSTNLISIYSL